MHCLSMAASSARVALPKQEHEDSALSAMAYAMHLVTDALKLVAAVLHIWILVMLGLGKLAGSQAAGMLSEQAFRVSVRFLIWAAAEEPPAHTGLDLR